MTETDPLENLLPSLIQCFSVILFGYLAVKFSLITSQSTAFGSYVTKFALPALFFRSMASINFNDVDWFFILAISMSKLILFSVTVICTLLITRPINFGMAGILSMFITQSNDVALGYPILLSLYPNLAEYIYLFAPAQLVFINPLCFILLEWQEHRSAFISTDDMHISAKRRILLVLKNVLLNPLVFMTLIGVIFNFLFHHKLPVILDKVLVIFADSFAGVALFYLGMNMVGKVTSITKTGIYVLIFLLLGKLIFLPFLAREMVVHILKIQSSINDSLNYSFVAFIYGGLPTAPPVFLIANNYQVVPDLIATGLVLGTFLSGPLMFVTTRVVTMVVASKDQFDSILKSTSVSVSVISLLGCIWVLVVFVLSRRWRSPLHKVTICYTFFLILTCSGLVIGRIVIPELLNQTNQMADFGHYFPFAIFFTGCVGSRVFTVLIAVSLLIIKRRTLSILVTSVRYIYIVGCCIPVVITFSLLILSKEQTIMEVDPSFQYGKSQMITSLVVLVICVASTIVLLILVVRSRSISEVESRYVPTLIDSESSYLMGDSSSIGRKKETSVSESINDVADNQVSQPHKTGDPKVGHTVNNETVKCDEEFQIQRHLTLAFLLVVTMGYGLFLCLWRLIKEEVSGIYIELEFLDCILNLGQGFILWAIFGLDTQLIVIPFKRKIITMWNNTHELYIPPESNLSIEAIRIRKQFLKFHLENCRRDIVRDIRYLFKLHNNVFSGQSLVDWLLRIGLANTRVDAIGYGQVLLIGRVIEHIRKNRNLIDNQDCLYRFVDTVDDIAVDQSVDRSVNIEDHLRRSD